MRGYFVVGGAGFIGSHIVDRLMADDGTAALTIYDNFSSGRDWHVARHREDRRFTLVRADVQELPRLATAMTGHDTVIHLADAPDTARSAGEGAAAALADSLALTRNILEAMRATGATLLLYASSDAVYGELGAREAREDQSPTMPTTAMGAGKLASEALISAYAHGHGMIGRAFRVTEVVGPRQTHGIAYDIVRRLLADPVELSVTQNGSRSVSFIHVHDVADAMVGVAQRAWSAAEGEVYRAYNLASADHITVREVVELAMQACDVRLDASHIRFETGAGRTRAGTSVQLGTGLIRATGWICRHSSHAAVSAGMQGLIEEVRAGLIEPAR
ncbi:MAG: NAD-dependent epimerase/dehydratase family protein [Alphaproteobacteria bacterium]|nr:NAD-dependent epimerase/dehydratase family protein [Alphaproteobacteria bacterium]